MSVVVPVGEKTEHIRLNKIWIVVRHLAYSISCELGVFLFLQNQKKGGTKMVFWLFLRKRSRIICILSSPKKLIKDGRFVCIIMVSKFLYSLWWIDRSFQPRIVGLMKRVKFIHLDLETNRVFRFLIDINK